MTVAAITGVAALACPASAKAMSLRKYHPSDKFSVVEICKNVYNGTDYLPRMIDHFAERPNTTILVSQPEGGSAVHGTVCGHRRGSAWFIFGLRVHEDARGSGVGRTLLESICRSCHDHGTVEHITSATIPQNPAANSILSGLGLIHTHTVDLWPTYAAMGAYEKAVGFVPGAAELPDYHISMADYITGARTIMSAASSNLGIQLSDWIPCSSRQQLEHAVASIRHQQQLFESELQELPSTVPIDWLPWVYEQWPLDAPYVNDRITNGDIWLLPATGAAARQHGSSHQQYRAAVLIDWSPEFRRKCAGVLTAGNAWVPSALQFVCSREPHFFAFVDRGSRHSSGKPDPDLDLPEILAAPEGDHSCFSVYAVASAHVKL